LAATGFAAAGLLAVGFAAAGFAAVDFAASGFAVADLAGACLAAAGFAADLSAAPLAAAGLAPAGFAAASLAVWLVFDASVVPAAPASSAGIETLSSSARLARSAVRRAAGVGISRVTLFPRGESHLRRHSPDVFD
jgi:hypothetical protein